MTQTAARAPKRKREVAGRGSFSAVAVLSGTVVAEAEAAGEAEEAAGLSPSLVSEGTAGAVSGVLPGSSGFISISFSLYRRLT